MIDREKMIELIQNAVGGCARHWAELIADHLLTNGVTVQKWIPVTERLPEESDADDMGRIWAIARAKKTRAGVWNWLTVRYSDCFTHWMPLPMPPEDGGADHGK